MRMSDEIVESALDVGAPVRQLSEEEVSRVVSALIAKFCARPGRWLWERVDTSVALQDADAWTLIAAFASDRPILLVESARGWEGIEFASTVDVVRVLGDLPGFEFVLSNASTDYFLAFNHHDFLVADGSAKQHFAHLFAARRTRHDPPHE